MTYCFSLQNMYIQIPICVPICTHRGRNRDRGLGKETDRESLSYLLVLDNLDFSQRDQSVQENTENDIKYLYDGKWFLSITFKGSINSAI